MSSSAQVLNSRQFKLLGEWDNEDKFGKIIQIRGTEKLSCPFEYEVVLQTVNDKIEKEKFCNKKFAFTLRNPKPDETTPEDQRHVHGMIKSASFSKAAVFTDPKEYIYTLNIVPDLHQTSKVKRTRIHYKEKQTVPDIIEAVLGEYAIEHQLDIKDRGTFIAETCKQFNETDFAFLHRLIAGAGFFYFFKHEESAHKMVISNKTASYFDISTEIKWCEEEGAAKENNGVKDINVSYSAYTKEFETKAFTYAKYHEPVEKTHSLEAHTQQDSPPAVKSQNVVYMQQAEDVSEVQNMADNSAIDALNVPETVEVSSGYRCIATGGKVKFAGKHFGKELEKKEYVIASMAIHASDKTAAYENNFIAIPKDKILLLTPFETTTSGPHPAIVVDKGGKDDPEEPVIDKKGQCYTYVKMLWGADTICRALVFSTFNAANVPKPGAFVNVWFMQSNSYADIPIIFGMHTPSMAELLDYEEAEQNTWCLYSAFHTAKEKDFFNSILFKDKKDQQEVELRAKKDMYSYVTDMRQTFVGVDKREDVEGKEDDDKEILVVKKGNKRQIICEGNNTLNVNKGDIMIEVKKGKYTLKVKQQIVVEADDDISFTTKKDFNITATGAVNINAGTDLALVAKVGASMKGSTFEVAGQAMGEIKAGIVKINS